MVSGLRGLLLAIVVLGALGLIAELLLLEHYEEWTQWLPLVALACVVPGAGRTPGSTAAVARGLRG